MNKARIGFRPAWSYWKYYLKHPLEFLRDAVQLPLWELKCFVQRGLYGYSDDDWYSLDDYLLTWLPSALREMRDKGIGHPVTEEVETYEDWAAILTQMAAKLDAQREALEGNEIDLPKDGLELFVKWFYSLWD